MDRKALHVRALATLVFVTSGTAFAVDMAQVPTLSQGDISINNDLAADVHLEATPAGCSAQRVTVRARESVVINGCSGAKIVKVSIAWKKSDGQLVATEQDLPVNTHYIFTWSDATKYYTRLTPLFDSQGRMPR